MPRRPIPAVPLPDFTRARDGRPRAVVIGAGMAGLVAARDLAAAGYAVTVLEAADRAGGCVGRHTVAGHVLDSGAESFATRTSAVADLATGLGLGDALVRPNPAGAWVQLPSGAVPLPKTGILGIPADPGAPEVRAALGRAGSLRAAADRWLPASVGTSGETKSIAELVRARMGSAVLDRLVGPVVGGVHSADPALLDVDMVAPGLRAAVRTHGSLAAAVTALRGAGSTPGSAVAGISGGMHRLVGALLGALTAAGVVVTLGARAGTITRTDDGGWLVSAGRAGSAGRTDAPGSLDYAAELLVIATDGPTAVRLLTPAIPQAAAYAPQSGPDVALVTLVVDRPELDARPRGTGVLVAPHTPGIRAKALTHASAKWDWLGAGLDPGVHVLRLSYGRAAEDATAPDAELLAAALGDAAALLHVPLAARDVLGSDVVRWPGTLPFAAVGHRKKVQAFRALAAGQGGLLVLGGWLAGNGLAAVVADASAQVAALA
ncbi:MAG: protoporphyrinogen/coproporphyrinogen oxidase [Actinomycetales bacterium]